MGVEGMSEEQALVEYDPPTEEEKRLDILIESEQRDVLATNGMEINIGRAHPTDMKNNREVRMPGPAPPPVEAQYNTRLGIWYSAFKGFKDRFCKENGNQAKSNLSPSQLIGLKTFGRKVARQEVIVLQAYKGQRFVVVDEPMYVANEPMYVAMAMYHIQKDIETTPEDVRMSQNVLSCTARGVGNVLGLGRAQPGGGYARCMDNLGGAPRTS